MSGFSTPVRRWITAPVALVACGALAGCSSGSPSRTAPTTPVGPGSSPLGAPGGTGDPASQLNAFASARGAGKKVTFKAVYTYRGTGVRYIHDGGTTKIHGVAFTGSVTVEQKPPEALLKTREGVHLSGVVLRDKTVGEIVCRSSGPPPECEQDHQAANTISSLHISPWLDETMWNPEYAVNLTERGIYQAVHQEPHSLSFFNRRFAGVEAGCVTYNFPTDPVTEDVPQGTYCVTKNGVVANASTQIGTITLTSYSANVSAKDFSLPAAAFIPTTTSLPQAYLH